MKIHRFYYPEDLRESKIEIEDKELVHQISKVLRLKIGEKIVLFDGKGNEAMGAITSSQGKQITVQIEKTSKKDEVEKNNIVLYCAILKRENFELVVQKATETGINEIVPIITSRTVKTGLNMDRLEKIIKEATEQSGRNIIPTIHEPLSFKESVEKAKENGLNILFHTSEAPIFFECLTSSPEKNKCFGIFIGPEGGFTEEEIILAKENDFKIASLGDFVLRGETAAIIASYLAVNLK